MLDHSKAIQQAIPKVTSMIEASLNAILSNVERELPASVKDVYTKEYMKFFNNKRKKEPTALELAEKIAKQESSGAPPTQAREEFIQAVKAPYSLHGTHTWQHKI